MKSDKGSKTGKRKREAALRLSLPPKVRAWLEELAGYGIYGKDAEEVAERFICDGIIRLLEPGGLLRVPLPDKRSPSK